MSQMFCFQCQQTAKGVACTTGGVCGKKADTSNLQDKLTGKLIALATATGGNCDEETSKVIINGMFATLTNVNFDNHALNNLCVGIDREMQKFATVKDTDMNEIWNDNEDIRSLKSLLLFGLRGMAAYALHAMVLGETSDEVNAFFLEGLSALGKQTPVDELLNLVFKLGNVNLTCMGLLDKANTCAYGNPVPTKVTCNIESGPFIVVSGHDLHDLHLLLQQTENKGINVYTHSEMLPAHGYPELKKYPHLKGNFGTAWQNQQKEFDNIPGAVLFTTNCLMPVKDSYSDRVFTTSGVSYPNMVNIDHKKDFSPVINKALELGGYTETQKMTGINGGDSLTTGFAHNAVLSNAEAIINSVKSGAIKHFFLVGGCDGVASTRSYYTDFVKQTPQDTVVLTLACGKFRFNDLDMGDINGIPRLLDMGQCNDAFSAIKVAVALSEAFNCSVNELPLTLVLSWYEQKAVCILLTLLALGIKNIYIGPSIPAFVSTGILNTLVEKFNLTPISTPENDLNKILSR